MNEETPIAQKLREYSERELGAIKVLMVEDDPYISEIVVTLLTKNGCIPYSTENGNEAITLAEQFMPHIIILDLMLPGISGEEILKTLKEKPGLKDIPVIVFTNRSEESDKAKVMALGAAEFFVKVSTDTNDLVKRIKELAQV